MNNLWEVVTVTDLIKLIKENPQKFVIVSLVLESTPKQLQTFIKKFIKDKAKQFPNMTFLYFKVNKRDLGKFSLIDKNPEVYPLIYHLYDINNVFIKVTSAVKDSIIEAFSKGEEYYIQDLQKQNKPQKKVQTEIQVTNIPTFKSNNHEVVLEKKVVNNNDTNNKVVNEDNQEENNQEQNQNQEQETMQQEWEKQQQIIARVVNLQQKAKEYNLELLEDIKQRKKEEEKLKKK